MFASKALEFFVLIVSLSFHEAAHAWTAYRLGDDTAARQGRLSLNPLAHLDPLGTLMLLAMPMGWAKPVPVNALNLRNPRGMLPLISFAGPLSNLALGLSGCVAWYFFAWHLLPDSGWFLMMQHFIAINFSLALFNLLPLHPLDGSSVITRLMSEETARRYEEAVSRMGMFPLILVVIYEMMPGPGVLEIWFRIWKPFFAPVMALFQVPMGVVPFWRVTGFE